MFCLPTADIGVDVQVATDECGEHTGNVASQSGASSSGPFTVGVPVATAGVEKECPVMCPTCPSVPAVTCVGPSKAHLPTSASLSGPAHGCPVDPVSGQLSIGGHLEG
jgi:hypothetical protein